MPDFRNPYEIKHDSSAQEISINPAIKPDHTISDLRELLDIFPPFYQVINNKQPING